VRESSCERVRLLRLSTLQVDPRVGEALEEMNSAMGSVNDSEAALTQARRRAKQVEAEQRKLCQVSAALHLRVWPDVEPDPRTRMTSSVVA